MSLKQSFTNFASRFSDFYKAHVFWRKIQRAMALNQRGEVRSDGLQMTSAKTTLRIDWLAREIHPWDRDLPLERAERLFSQQCLDDANAAISRLFAEIPVLDSIEVRVRRDISRPTILEGTVYRRDSLSGNDYASTGMRLRAIGLRFRMSNLCLEEFEVI
ncbi:MAG TPA: hypothetical protein VLI44_09350 [Sporolactobacillaceae bacterium]|nr:hypothetical protein [Sporolactobacillaceae bacterium]